MNKRHFRALIILAVLMLILSPAGFFSSGISLAQVGTYQGAGLTQHSSTTGGELRRYIDISSPWSGGYLHEDLTVIGSATVTESFTMNNLGPGSEAENWKKKYDNFGIGFEVFPGGASPSVPSVNQQRGAINRPAAAVAGASAVAEPEAEVDIRAGFRWLDLF